VWCSVLQWVGGDGVTVLGDDGQVDMQCVAVCCSELQ